MKKLLLLTLCLPAFGMKEITNEKVMKMGEAKKAALFHDGKQFLVKEDGIVSLLGNHQLDNNLRNIKGSTLDNRLKNSYLTLYKSHDGSYSVKENGRLNGGGLITATVVYWGIKIGGRVAIALGVKKIAEKAGANMKNIAGSNTNLGNTADTACNSGGLYFVANNVTSGVGGVGSPAAYAVNQIPGVSNYINTSDVPTGAVVVAAGAAGGVGGTMSGLDALANMAYEALLKSDKCP